MKKTTAVNWQHLIHIAEGCATEEEIRSTREWIDVAPEAHRQILDHVIAIYADNDPGRKMIREQISKRVETQFPGLFDATEPQVLPFVPAAKKRSLVLLRRIAAAAFLAIGLFLAGKQGLMRYIDKTGKATIAWKTVRTNYGQEALVTLPDHSTVKLAPGSRLRYPEQFDAKERLVQLEGAAFFDITKNPSKPFIVKASRLYTKVLGTSFEMVCYADEPLSTVTLITGKVLIHKKDKQDSWQEIACLSPQQQLSLDNDSRAFTIDAISPKASQDIQQGKLVFESNTLQEIVKGLVRKFNIHARFKPGLTAPQHISASFDQSMSLQDISHILSQVSGVSITANRDSLYIGY